jgi:hypothetical protein
VRFRACALALGFSWLATTAAASAADKPDPALLEFLGSVDTEDKAWHDYLAHTDIDQLAKRAAVARSGPAPVPPGAVSPPASQPTTASPPPKVQPTSSAAPANPSPPVNHP